MTYSPGEDAASICTSALASSRFVAALIQRWLPSELNARAELFQRVGHEVISVPNSEAAKQVLASIDNVDVFVVGHAAPEQTRKDMVDWVKEDVPKVKIVALVPSASLQLPRADYNVVLNDLDEWLALLAITAS